MVLLTDFVEVDPASLERSLGILARRHQALLVALRDPLYGEIAIPGTAASDPAGTGPYRRIVLDDLLREREVALAALRRLGVQTLDLPPEAATAPVLNRYLAIRHGPER